MSNYLSKRFSGLQAYVPGEQPQDMQYIKLNTNESPYPPSDQVIQAITRREIENLRLYSDPDCTALRKKAAALYGVGEHNILFGNGSDEILSFAFMAFCDQETGVVFPEISYGFYKVFADLYGLDYETVPLKPDLSIDVQAYCGVHKTVVIANPNAPTGLLLSVKDIEKIAASNPDHVVVIDEAYIDFGGTSCYSLIDRYDNLLVVRTFSKSRCLAGARLGFAIASEKIIGDLNTIRFSTNPYNINRLTLLAGEAAIDDNDYYVDKCRQIAQTRAYTQQRLMDMGFSVTASKANFVFAELPGVSGKEMYQKLKTAGILVRRFDTDKIKDYLRITIGTKEQMDRMFDALEEIIK